VALTFMVVLLRDYRWALSRTSRRTGSWSRRSLERASASSSTRT